MNEDYDFLVGLYNQSCQICDPIDFANRKRNLLNYLAEYIIQRDKPKEEGNVDCE